MAGTLPEYDPYADLSGGMRLNKWCKLVGISKMTAWRLRKAGKLKTITRYGMVFIQASEIKRFWEERV